jgi:2-polyprenyl-6-methoxyphenol hydroxylase-like FAD-dependent oxidoreductase
MSEPFDLITVGGGLAGAALARSLAEKGARVLILERDQKFKDRVRGEMLTPWGVAEAESLGIARLLRASCGHEHAVDRFLFRQHAHGPPRCRGNHTTATRVPHFLPSCNAGDPS